MPNGDTDERITKIQADVVGKALDAQINFLVDPIGTRQIWENEVGILSLPSQSRMGPLLEPASTT